MNKRMISNLLMAVAVICLLPGTLLSGDLTPHLKRAVPIKPVYQTLPQHDNTNEIIFKLREGMGQPVFDGARFQMSSAEWDRLNQAILSHNKSAGCQPHFSTDKASLDQMREEGSRRIGQTLPDLSLYYRLSVAEEATPNEKLELVRSLNALDIVETAYIAPKPELANIETETRLTPVWEVSQWYLQPAPTGIDAYYGWNFPGGRGENVKFVDIEGNWVESHEDLHGGTDSWHIAGTKVLDPGWWHHGTAVLGEVAADSNSFGMTGIAFNVDLGTVSIGSMSTASAIITATNNTVAGDIILIELHAPGPNAGGSGQQGYVAMEYWQENFDVILTASANGRIVVEAAGNGEENYDDTTLYGHLFDPDFRYSGAVMVGAGDLDHLPEWFTNYGERVDVHGFGSNVFTLGYGDLYGSDTTDYYTAHFGGTSSASPIIVGACAVLQGIHQEVHGRPLDYVEMHELLMDFSTPQAPHYKEIGPMPDLRGSCDQIVGVSFTADTTIGWAPLAVNFSASSGLAVDTWTWDFGDGGADSIQSPAYTYNQPGMFDVSLQVQAGEDTRTSIKTSYIKVLADSMIADTGAAFPGELVELVIYGRNSIPINEIIIPVEYSGDLVLTYDHFSTDSCRTDYFEEQSLTHLSPSTKTTTVRLQASSMGSAPDLAPGAGPILRLYFQIDTSAQFGQTTPILVDGYSTHLPEFNGDILEYQPRTVAGLARLCLQRGDMDGIEGITIADLVFLTDYMFSEGIPPFPLETADVDCSGTTDIADLVYLVDWMFNDGPEPCGC